MIFFQEPAFTAFLALILTFLVAKVVSFAVSNSRTDDNTVVYSVNEGAAAKEAILDKGLRVRRSKSKKKVKFVDDVDVVIKRVDRYEGGENPVLLDVDESVGKVIVEEKSGENDDQFGGNGLDEDSEGKFTKEPSVSADPQDTESEKVEMPMEKEVTDEIRDGVFREEERNEVKLLGNDLITDTKLEANVVAGCGENEGLIITRDFEEERDVRNDEIVEDEDDDWEGIERSELEKVFAEAVNYMEYGGKGKDRDDDRLAKMGSDVQMQLYGLHKLAVEGPCHEPQPMALKVSARAKWNAWQNLGSMNQDEAMEQYISVLSDNIPGWMHHYSADDDVQVYPKLETGDEISVPEYERNLGKSAATIGDSSTGRSSFEKDNSV